MLWVTWRQHRGLLITVAAVFCAAVAGLLVAGLRIHHDYALLVACRPAASPACQGLSNFFNSTDWHQGQLVHVAVQAAPVLVAMFAGPPVVARDLETRTFRFAWTQGIGRVRWTVAKLAILGSLLTILAFVDQPAADLVLRPVHDDPAADRPHPDGVRHQRPLLRRLDANRVLPRRVPRRAAAQDPRRDGGHARPSTSASPRLTWFYLRDHYPVTTYWPMQLFEAGWLLALSAALVAATIWLVRRYAE